MKFRLHWQLAYNEEDFIVIGIDAWLHYLPSVTSTKYVIMFRVPHPVGQLYTQLILDI